MGTITTDHRCLYVCAPVPFSELHLSVNSHNVFLLGLVQELVIPFAGPRIVTITRRKPQVPGMVFPIASLFQTMQEDRGIPVNGKFNLFYQESEGKGLYVVGCAADPVFRSLRVTPEADFEVTGFHFEEVQTILGVSILGSKDQYP